MKKFIITLANLLIITSLLAQSPEKMSYQAIIRDAGNNLIIDQPVGMQFSIIQENVFGTSVYVENQIVTTDANGLVATEIGSDLATVLNGNFATIDWSSGPYFLKTEIDPEGGADYTITGTSQLLSVPYALHAKVVESVSEQETDPSVPQGTQIGEMQYWNGSEWVTIIPGFDGSTFTLVNGIPTWIKPLVTNPVTGKTWMDRNLGAIRTATSSTDANAYGDLYQWGRAADGHEDRTSGTTSTISNSDTPGHGDFITVSNSPFDWRSPQNDNLWQGESGANNPCPSGYRLPTEAEWEAEIQSWSSKNSAGAFASTLKLPAAGARDLEGALFEVGPSGYYWSGTVASTNTRVLAFGSGDASMANSTRGWGVSVRCIKD